MTPAARLAAAIALLDAVLAGAPADRCLTDWGRRSRFAGSGDRQAVADLVYDGLRRRRSLGWAGGAETGRGIVLALAAERGELPLLTGEGHAPAPPDPAERAALGRASLDAAPEGVRLDMPDWLLPELRRSAGEGLAAELDALRARAPLDLRVNLLFTDREGAAAALAAEGIATLPLGEEPAALRVTAGGRALQRSTAFAAGLVEVQDVASQRVARFAGAFPGARVLDYCAGGGGKTLALGMHMGGRGRLLAHDAAPARMADLPVRAARAGLSVEVLPPDRPGSEGLACDLVLADAPCSGSGAWRRNPDAKWRLDAPGLAALLALQDRVLDAALRHVRPGGRLVYATCSILEAENGDRLSALLARHPALRPEGELRLPLAAGGDGFYAAAIRRVS